ncbi:hypothetical protein EVAR_34565_1 [Eumeta japonica]|uniref:Uncharacterized protein n=1 Tax=Eumeta variegata TaxID=151549 RepID=A0A4C1X6P3_EUMVA|nr:hypothetical protein EVAR_34565_1 [Eumeta japonica]
MLIVVYGIDGPERRWRPVKQRMALKCLFVFKGPSACAFKYLISHFTAVVGASERESIGPTAAQWRRRAPAIRHSAPARRTRLQLIREDAFMARYKTRPRARDVPAPLKPGSERRRYR